MVDTLNAVFLTLTGPTTMTPRLDRTSFRRWFEDCLRGLRGRKVEWPQLVRYILAQKVEEIRSCGVYYKGDVFIDRDADTDKVRLDTRPSEKLHVRQLYRLVHEQRDGLLRLGNEEVWLVTWEVPNQGEEQSNKTKGRRLDLLGICQDGSLVAFECKAEANTGNTPLYALLEGLDYLGCLLTDPNMQKLTDDFRRWRDKDRTNPGGKFVSSVPSAFRNTEIRPDGCHKVIVLAPSAYYKNNEFDSQSIPQDWWFLSDRFWKQRLLNNGALSIQLDFATTTFSEPKCELLPLPWLDRA